MQNNHDSSVQNPDFNLNLGNNIRSLRKKRGVSQEYLAELVDLSVDTIRRIESGGGTKIDTLWKIALVLDVSIGCLWSDSSFTNDGLDTIIESIDHLKQLVLEYQAKK